MRRVGIVLWAVAVLGIWTESGVAEEQPGHICFRKIDADQDGKVTFDEFAAYFGNREKMFRAGDANGDGWLTHDEYHDFVGHGAPGKSTEK